MKALVTVVGTSDPWMRDGSKGPILNLLSSVGSFDSVHFLYAQSTERNLEETAKALGDQYNDAIVPRRLQIENVNDTLEALVELKSAVDEITNSESKAKYVMVVSSGTKAMSYAWMMLAMSKAYPDTEFIRLRQPDDKSPDVAVKVSFDRKGDSIWPRVQFWKELLRPTPKRDWKDAAKHIIGNSEQFQKVLDEGAKVATTDMTVLLRGERGTGKGDIAKFIHTLSQRTGSFVTCNLNALPKDMFESELFGFEEGSFSGAKKGGSRGRALAAQGGTLFLDEIGELPLDFQVKLLNFIQDKQVPRLGGHVMPVDVRIIAATNADLEQKVLDKEFRTDLLDRLQHYTIEIPALRQRRPDIPLLASHFLSTFNRKHERSVDLSDATIKLFQQYSWPGNVRELMNNLDGAFVRYGEKDFLEPEDFPRLQQVMNQAAFPALEELIDLYPGFDCKHFLGQVRETVYRKALNESKDNVNQAAELLGVTPKSVYEFLNKQKRR